MPTPNRPKAQNKYSEQNIANTSFDEDFGVQTFEPLGFDGSSLQRSIADSMAVKITTSGSDTYVGLAAPGTLQSSSLWQAFKYSSGVLTYAGGSASFNNVATDLTALSYS